MILSQKQDLIESFSTLQGLYFIHSLGYRFLPFEDKRDCLGIHNLFKLAKFGLILVVLT